MNRTIDKHISRLLFHHECVVVPSFGAFLTRQYAAEFNASTHMFRPMGKRLSFNARINQNDGLLASYISKTEGISYNEALESITISVRAWKRILRSGKKVHLPNIGRLYMDEDAKLQFSPSLEINYDVHAYGLGIFRAPSVQREIAIEEGINKVIESSKNGKLFKGIKPYMRWAAILAPIIGLGIYASVAIQPIREAGIQGFSSMFPEWALDTPVENKIRAVVPHELPTIEIVAPYFEIEETAEDQGEADIRESADEVAPVKKVEEREKPQPKKLQVPIQNGAYHIVVGSFKDEANAQKYIDILRSKQVEAYIAEGTPRFYRVAVSAHSTRSKAEKALSDVKAKVNSGAWVYRP